jgi:acetoin utilization deacetylase AcuC-like enzyme
MFIQWHPWLNAPVKIITDERCTGYSRDGHPENPRRVAATIALLKSQTDLPITWVTPGKTVPREIILRAHEPAVLDRLRVPEDFDADTPYYENIADFAMQSVAAALLALEAARKGETVFSLMRPPGHHATRQKSMGFCYLNNVAIATLEALATGTKRVAVLDFDVHHGNGTEDILLNQPGVEFFSVHLHPEYPHTGAQNAGHNCFNYPIIPSASRMTYRAKLANALDDLRSFRPELIAVSAGFDPYVNDPLADGALVPDDFHWIGQSLRALNVPMFSLLEGGYSQDLPDLIFAYLKGLDGK